MLITTSRQGSAAFRSARQSTAPATLPEERFPHQVYREPMQLEKTSLSEVGEAAARGLAEGAVYGVAVGGGLATVMAFLGQSGPPANPGVFLGVGAGLGALVVGVATSVLSALEPFGKKLELQQRHQDLAQIVRAGDLKPEESKTATYWKQLKSRTPIQELDGAALETLGKILSEMKARGMHLNCHPQQATRRLLSHDLAINGQVVDSLDELKLLDATSGGGLTILSPEEREAVELMAGMAHRGFEIGRYQPERVITHFYKIPTMASEVFEKGFDGSAIEPPLEVRSSKGTFTVRTLQGLRQLDDEAWSPRDASAVAMRSI